MKKHFKFLLILLSLSINGMISALDDGPTVRRKDFMEALSYSPAQRTAQRGCLDRRFFTEMTAAHVSNNSVKLADLAFEHYVASASWDVFDQAVDSYRQFEALAKAALVDKKAAHRNILHSAGVEERYNLAVACAAIAYSRWQAAEQAKKEIINTIDFKTVSAMKAAAIKIRRVL